MGYKKMSYLLQMLLCLLVLSACEFNTVFSNFQKIDKDGWNVQKPITFDFKIENIEQPHDILVSVRHDKNYPYSNLWIKIIDEDENIFSEDKTLQFKLADKTGEWLGKCSNTYCTESSLLKENFLFPDTGTYSLLVYQHMRVDNLKHLKAVGLTITKSETGPGED